jgi:hypothetical protein
MGTESGRHQLYEELKAAMSQDSADELMSSLPPVGWADVATKADLGVMRNEMDALRAELRGEMALLRAEIQTDMAKGFTSQTRWLVGAIFVALTFGIALASAIG